jgi:hypothetical protein
MSKLMIICPKTGKEVFTGEKYDFGTFKHVTLTSHKIIVRCPHCGENHDVKDVKYYLVPEISVE